VDEDVVANVFEGQQRFRSNASVRAVAVVRPAIDFVRDSDRLQVADFIARSPGGGQSRHSFTSAMDQVYPDDK
jgi:hypothetical protein